MHRHRTDWRRIAHMRGEICDVGGHGLLGHEVITIQVISCRFQYPSIASECNRNVAKIADFADPAGLGVIRYHIAREFNVAHGDEQSGRRRACLYLVIRVVIVAQVVDIVVAMLAGVDFTSDVVPAKFHVIAHR